ncbi:hypothetical protein [Pseudofrankia asymbiotica]|uniref:Uncharacterized protein n=1 Tax=Pseudofrankia asymbiotica TaxID=1834516 RepID=A0A1V2I6Z9_9ACTN|nr:hypothetical protein [Pseudofrankia asymbiotica]ONH27290.1 hypothetical protein BL253_22270 [Pseudofrankia asymbiotica]
MPFPFGRKRQAPNPQPATRQPSGPRPATRPVASTAPMAQVEKVVTAAAALRPVTDAELKAEFDGVRQVWGATRIIAVARDPLRARLTDVLASNLKEGFEIEVETTDDPLSFVMINCVNPRAGTWRPYRVARLVPTKEQPEERFGLYGHSSLYAHDAAVQYVETDTKSSGAVFHVHRGPNREAALAFLRERPVREKLVYQIVETPQGNVGRDLIYIFEEKDGKPIEYGVRPRLAQPRPSTTHCAWCGFYVAPLRVDVATSGPSTATVYLTVAEMKDKGNGFRCEKCALLQCVFCTDFPPTASVMGHPAPCGSCGADLAQSQLVQMRTTDR